MKTSFFLSCSKKKKNPVCLGTLLLIMLSLNTLTENVILLSVRCHQDSEVVAHLLILGIIHLISEVN